MATLDVSVHLGDGPLKRCYLSFCRNVGVSGQPTACVEIEGVGIFFKDPAQISQVMAVMADAHAQLEALIAENARAEITRANAEDGETTDAALDYLLGIPHVGALKDYGTPPQPVVAATEEMNAALAAMPDNAEDVWPYGYTPVPPQPVVSAIEETEVPCSEGF